MLAIKKILVPVDFSDGSRDAMEYAVSLAERLASAVDLLHVWDLPREVTPGAVVTLPGLAGQPIEALVEGQARRDMKGFLAIELPEARVGTILLRGDPANTILKVAAEGGYDLVVMGTHGRRGLTHALLGSVAERVVRFCRVPVVTIRGAVAAAAA